MPQLTCTSCTGERGSALVAVVAFAIIISIAAGGLLMLAANSVSNETAELDDYQALLAAESGLQVGLRWLGELTTVPPNWQTANTTPSLLIGIFAINGFSDTVATVHENNRLVLRSRAANNRVQYVKEVACNVDSSFGFGLATNSWDPAFPSLDNIWFDGPVQANVPVVMAIGTYPPPLGKRHGVFFLNGAVTITDIWTGLFNDCIGPSGNNYTYGIDIEGPLNRNSRVAGALDRYFDNTFTYTTDSVKMPAPTGISTLPTHSYQGWNIMPTIYFYVDPNTNQGMYTYYYHAVSTGPVVAQISTQIGANTIIYTADSIRVLGTVKGRVTIITPPNMSIYPVGDLWYSGFTRIDADYSAYNPQNNYGVNVNSPNYLALIAGGDIHFSAGRQQNINTANGSFTNAPPGATVFINAALYATNPGKGIRWDTIAGSGNISLGAYQYNICLIGSRTVDQFFNYPARSNIPVLANTQFRFYYDRRLSSGLSAPGVPAFRRITPAGNNLYFLKTTNRRELNIARP